MNKGSAKKTIMIFLICLVAVFGAGYALANHYFSQLTIERVEPFDSITRAEPSQLELRKDDVAILLMGTDKSGNRTDSMLVINAHFDSNTTSLFSIPRDYKVSLTNEVQQAINYHDDYIKLTELYAYAKSADYKNPSSLTASAVEEIFGFKFDHIVLFNLSAFRQVVDAVGGVEVNVPQRLKYDDPYQNLNIDLHPGVQLLNGETAEDLVRFRKGNTNDGYGDFNRMEVQQYFLKEFIKKLISLENVLNFNALFEVVKDNVKTDADLNEALYLLSRSANLNMDRVYSHTLAGKDIRYNGKYMIEPPPLNELHAQIHSAIEADQAPTLSSKHYDIIVLNGSDKPKRAANFKAQLTEDGFNVIKIGDYYQTHTMKTRIIVPDLNLGRDLQQYFSLSEIIVDDEAEAITVVLGMLVE